MVHIVGPLVIEPTQANRICVVRLSAIGDTCHALAVVRAIQDFWPAAKLTWIIGKTEAGLLADIPDIEFIIFDKQAGLGAYADIRSQLSGRHFDIALCMHASMRANFLSRLIPSFYRLGFDRQRARDFQWLFTNQRIAAATNQHVLDGMMGFAKHIGVPGTPLRWDIPLSAEDQSFATDVTAGDKPVMLISPCSSQRSRNFRNWSAADYTAAAKHAVEKHGCKVILTGGPTKLEREYGQQIQQLSGPHVTNQIGKTSLKQLLALIAASDLLVCPDSGPVHMATAVGTPVIGLYATSNPARSGPYLNSDLTVDAYGEAAQRYLGKSIDQLRWGQRVRSPDAMELIHLQDVNRKIDDFFSR